MSTERRCAFLTMEDTSGWSIDADLAIPSLNALGWDIDTVPWRATGIDWTQYDAVYIGTPWDYPEDPDGFLALLARIEAAGTLVANPLSLVRWNLYKTYLRDLEERGADIVPTAWHDGIGAAQIPGLFDETGSDRIIIKPVVSTNATDTFLLTRGVDAATCEDVAGRFTNRAAMVQPFIPAIQDEGEFSLFYIGGALSHAIRKVPKSRDFRVQEEHGARIDAVRADANLERTGNAVMALVEPQPLYARVDFVRGPDDRLLLMELELIEPSLYLRMEAGAPARFAEAFDAWVRERRRKGKK